MAKRGKATPLSCSLPEGFTLVELVGVLVVTAVLAIVALPRLYNLSAFDARAFRDEVASSLRYAQKTAIAHRRCVYVVISGNSLSLFFDHDVNRCAAQGSPVSDPAGTGAGAPYVRSPRGGVGLTASIASFRFDPLGSPQPDQSITLTVSGDVVQTITVERNTGYVH